MTLFVSIIISCLFVAKLASSQTLTSTSKPLVDVTFEPISIHQLPMGASQNISLNLTQYHGKDLGDIVIIADIKDENIATVLNVNEMVIFTSNPCTNLGCWQNGIITVQGVFLGFTEMDVKIHLANETIYENYSISVILLESELDKIFPSLLITFICLMNLTFGCDLDLRKAKEIFKKPIAPLLGFLCQYTLMPSLAYCYGYLLKLSMPLALGFLALGCSPGGGPSNILSLHLGGDLTLSLCMTFISTVAALGMMPLWLLTLGTHIAGSVQIPFLNIVISLTLFTIPVFIGIIIRIFSPKVSGFIQKIIYPISFLVIIAGATIGIYTQLYMVYLVTWRVALAAALLPVTAFILAGILAGLARQPKDRIITIALETSIQNVTVALVLVKTNLEQPSGNIAAVLPQLSAIMTQVPFVLAVIIKKIYEKGYQMKAKSYNVENATMKNINLAFEGAEESKG